MSTINNPGLITMAAAVITDSFSQGNPSLEEIRLLVGILDSVNEQDAEKLQRFLSLMVQVSARRSVQLAKNRVRMNVIDSLQIERKLCRT